MLIPLLELFADGRLPQSGVWLAGVLAGYLALIAGKALLGRRLTISQTAFLEGYTCRLRGELYDALSGAGWQQLAAYRQADLVGLFTTQCSQVSNAVSCTIRLLASLVSAAIQIAIACYMSVPVTLAVFLCGLGMMAAFLPLRRKAQDYGNEMIATSRDFYSELIHQLNSVKEIRTYAVEDTHRERFENRNRAFGDKQVAYAKVHSLPGVVSSLAAGGVLCAMVLLSLVCRELDMTRLVILVLIFSRLWPLFSSWQNAIQTIQTNLPALQKLKQTVEELNKAGVKAQEEERLPFAKEIRFSHVGFRYRQEGTCGKPFSPLCPCPPAGRPWLNWHKTRTSRPCLLRRIGNR